MMSANLANWWGVTGMDLLSPVVLPQSKIQNPKLIDLQLDCGVNPGDV